MRFRSLGLMVLAPVLATCATEPVVTTVTLNSTSVTLDAIGATSQLSASLTDADGKAVQENVSWTSSDANVATVSEAGLVTATGNGTAEVTAAAGGVTARATVTVQQVVNTVQKVAGDGQMGEAGAQLPALLEIEVQDRLGVPIAALAVAFNVTAGGGSITPDATTGADGRATATWILGTSTADAHTAQAGAGGKSATFTATAVAGPADSLVEVSGDGQAGPPGAMLPNPLVVRVADQYGNPVEGHTVGWAVTSGGGSVNPTSSVTGATGQASTQWTLGNTLGPQTAEATASGVSTGSPVPFSANAVNSSMAVNDGDNQTGLVSKTVNLPPSVIIRDASNQPLAGVSVTFSVLSGGGSVTGATTVTGTDGVAEVGSWTLGTAPGTNELQATANAVGVSNNPLTFTATGQTAQFDIDVRIVGSMSSSRQQIFADAAARWELLVFGDLADVSVSLSASEMDQCVEGVGAFNETIDDVIIYAKVEAIDGVGGVLGRAGPCFVRSSNTLTLIGRMVFDDADVDALETAGEFDEVILHEMGHVLGYGALWPSKNLLVNPSCPSSPGVDTHFPGALAVAAFDRVGGDGYSGGEKVPVENDMSASCPGTRDGHWRESELDAELMTGGLNTGVPNPLSIVSVASLGDIGYTVSYADADTYVYPSAPALTAGATGRIQLVDDVYRGPIFFIDETGRVVRTLYPEGAR